MLPVKGEPITIQLWNSFINLVILATAVICVGIAVWYLGLKPLMEWAWDWTQELLPYAVGIIGAILLVGFAIWFYFKKTTPQREPRLSAKSRRAPR